MLWSTWNKTVIWEKPVRFGFKLWCLCSYDGYMVHAEPYCGSSTDLPNAGYGQGGDIVLGLVGKCKLRAGHEISFDNLFTGLPLLDQLSAIGIGGTGTVWENRIPKEAHNYFSISLMKTKPWGSMSSIGSEDKILVTWKDNNSEQHSWNATCHYC